MMTEAKYDGYEPHKAAHDEFVAKISGLSSPVSGDTVHFAKDWSVNVHVFIRPTVFITKSKIECCHLANSSTLL